jgi:DNA-binding transcriptional ArsR family regulator
MDLGDEAINGAIVNIGSSEARWEVSKEDLKRVRSYFRALGDSVRLRIVIQLSVTGEMGVSRLGKALRVSQPLVSWHLRKLRKVGLVRIRKKGRQVYCSLDREKFKYYRRWLADILAL